MENDDKNNTKNDSSRAPKAQLILLVIGIVCGLSIENLLTSRRFIYYRWFTFSGISPHRISKLHGRHPLWKNLWLNIAPYASHISVPTTSLHWPKMKCPPWCQCPFCPPFLRTAVKHTNSLPFHYCTLFMFARREIQQSKRLSQWSRHPPVADLWQRSMEPQTALETRRETGPIDNIYSSPLLVELEVPQKSWKHSLICHCTESLPSSQY